jgi:ATP-dependent Clp protease ATP-binding subunit ClpA
MAAVPVPLDPSCKCPEALRLENDLRARVIGQNEAISQIVDQYQTYLAGLTERGHPISSLLLLGPTGCGKTRLVEAVAEAFVGNRQALIKIDCAEFQHSHEIAKLVGSPPGYLGHRETHARLSQDRLNEFHTETVKVSFVLFDEIEKASDALWNLLLGILDKATLTLGDNRQVDFSQCMVFLTGNLGTAEMQRLRDTPVGFGVANSSTSGPGGRVSPALRQKMEKTALEAARRKFSPEFLNRLDRIVLCQELSREDMGAVLELELHEILSRVQRQHGIGVRVSLDEAVRNHLLNEGYDERYGARHLKRTLYQSFLRPLSSFLSNGHLADGDELLVSLDRETRALSFHRERRVVTRRTLRELSASWQSAAPAPAMVPPRWRVSAVRS